MRLHTESTNTVSQATGHDRYRDFTKPLSEGAKIVRARAEYEAQRRGDDRPRVIDIFCGLLRLAELKGKDLAEELEIETIEYVLEKEGFLIPELGDIIRDHIARIEDIATSDEWEVLGRDAETVYKEADEHGRWSRENGCTSSLDYAEILSQRSELFILIGYIINVRREEQIWGADPRMMSLLDRAEKQRSSGDGSEVKRSVRSKRSARAGVVEKALYAESIQRYITDHVIGQDHAAREFAAGIFSAELTASQNGCRKGPHAIFVFAGPSGVGKTYMAEIAAAALGKAYRRFDMSEYSADNDVFQDLIGWSETWKDARPGILTEFVAENPNSVLLFDEIEKASSKTLNIFLQILDSGQCVDAYTKGPVSFKEVTMIFTTNAGRDIYEGDDIKNFAGLPRDVILSALKKDTHRSGVRVLSPELCSRLATGKIVMFNHMSASGLERIVRETIKRESCFLSEDYKISVECAQTIPSALLFSCTAAEPRNLTVLTSEFFRKELLEISKKNKKVRKIRFTVSEKEMNDNDELYDLFHGKDDIGRILVFADDGDTVSVLKKEGYSAEAIGCVMKGDGPSDKNVDEKRTVKAVLERLNRASADKAPFGALFMEASESTSSKKDSGPGAARYKIPFALLREVRTKYPDLPVYIVEDDIIRADEHVFEEFIAKGVNDKVNITEGGTKAFLDGIAASNTMQAGALKLERERKVLRYVTAVIPDKSGSITVELRNLELQVAIDALDKDDMLMGRPDTRFADLIGIEDAVTDMRELIDSVKRPGRGQKPPKGILLHGPAGTGKTMLAMAAAGETEDMVFLTKDAGKLNPYEVTDLFRRARKYAPSIIFIDEIDSIGLTRSANMQDRTTLLTFLTEMDGLKTDAKKPVFVIAATNAPVDVTGNNDNLDPALVRRFDRTVYMTPPNAAARKKYIEDRLSVHGPDNVTTEDGRGSIAARSEGMNIAKMKHMIDRAVRHAEKNGGRITDEILDDALETVMFGSRTDVDESSSERTSWHEAGHAYVNYKLTGEIPRYTTVVSRGGHGGYTMLNKHGRTAEGHLERICCLLAGRAAEIVRYGDCPMALSDGASQDLAYATKHARDMICRYGMDPEFGLVVMDDKECTIGPLAEKIAIRAGIILREQMDRAVRIITDNREEFESLTRELQERKSLSGNDMERLLK